MVLKIGYFVKQTRNTSKVLKRGAGEGGRRSVDSIMWEMKKYHESRKRGISYKQ